MNYYGYELIRESDLAHHGIKGQKWGQRRFQNEDGSWTAAGKERYGGDGGGQSRSFRGNVNRALAKVYGVNEKYYSKHGNKVMANANKSAKEAQLKKAEEADKAKNTPEAKAKAEKMKKAAKIGAAVAGTALAAYGVYKLNQMATNKLKAGDLYAAKQRQLMADMHLDNYVKQMAVYRDYKGSNPITSNTSKEKLDKLNRMISTANSAANRYNSAKREAQALRERASSGRYTLKEKAGVIRGMIRR